MCGLNVWRFSFVAPGFRIHTASYLLLFALIGCASGGGEPAFTGPVFDVLKYGAVGDGTTLDTPAIQKAIDAAEAAGGGRVLLADGRTYLSGQLRLGDGIDFHVAEGATLLASDLRALYQAGNEVLLFANEAKHPSISGRGVIDGNSSRFITISGQTIHRMASWRPGIIKLIRCPDVRIQDIAIRNSSHWTVHLVLCRNAAVENVRMRGDRKVPNNDGLVIDRCRSVKVNGCEIDTGDDAIVIKNTARYNDGAACEDISVDRCILGSNSSAFKIGSECIGDFRRISFTNSEVLASNRGIAIQIRDSGRLSDMTVSDVRVETRLMDDAWWGKAEPIYVTVFPRRLLERPGKVSNVKFKNIRARGESGVFIAASDRTTIENLTLENVQIEIRKISDYPGGVYDTRPGEGNGLLKQSTAGIYASRVTGLTLRNCAVTWGSESRDAWGAALEARKVVGLVVERFTGRSGRPETTPDRIDEP